MTLHELPNAYHDQVLGFGQRAIRAVFERPVAERSYE